MLQRTRQPDLLTKPHSSSSSPSSTLDDVARLLRDGCFVVVNYFCTFSGGGHYAPIVETDDSAVYLFDSSYGLFRLSNHEFEPFRHSTNGDIRRWLLAVR